MINDVYFYARGTKKPQDKISFTIHSLEAYNELSNAQQKLLTAMIRRVKAKKSVDDIIGEDNYDSFGYNSRQNFHRDKKALEDAGFLITRKKQYVVCFHRISYLPKGFYNEMMEWFRLKAGVYHGQGFKPTPGFMPKPLVNVTKK